MVKMPGLNPQRRGTARTLPNFCVVLCIVCFVSFCVLFVCKMCTVLLPPGGYPTAVNKNYINLHVPHGHWLFLVRFLLTPTCTFFFCVKGNLLWPWVPPSLPNVGTGFSFPEVKRGFHHPSPYKRRGRVWLQLYLYLPWALYCVFRVNLKKKF